MTRRQFQKQILTQAGLLLAAPARHLHAQTGSAKTPSAASPPAFRSGSRPEITHGISSGDVGESSAVVWSRTDRPSRMRVEWSTTESFASRHALTGPFATADSDFTAKLLLPNLPPGQRIHYRVAFEDPASPNSASPWETGSFLTPSPSPSRVRFAWSGDTCGQGYGIDLSRGGLRTYASIHKLAPDFFVHSGDTIYADNALQSELALPDGTVWKNLVTEEKSRIAETLGDLRGNFRYNLLDSNVRAFHRAVPTFVQWDDHEVLNNWFPGQRLESLQVFRSKEASTIARHALQAFFEYHPIRPDPARQIYRRIRRGPLCELFFLDLRSYRGPNSPNRQQTLSPESGILGDRQLQWLKQSLRESTALWKIVCSDMPLALMVRDGASSFEAFANGDGPPLGRELELADLLRSLKQARVRNILWLTADVHYAASHHFSPDRAQFTEFDPFWEFVSGPLHAGAFGPTPLDPTFGPEAVWRSRTSGTPSSGPYSTQQYFGIVDIDPKTRAATVTHHDRDGTPLWSRTLPPHDA